MPPEALKDTFNSSFRPCPLHTETSLKTPEYFYYIIYSRCCNFALRNIIFSDLLNLVIDKQTNLTSCVMNNDDASNKKQLSVKLLCVCV